MVVNDRTRRVLAARLERVLGAEEADVLMESLPPSGWADVLTKPDLDAFEERTDLRFRLVESRLDRIEPSLDRVEERLGRVETKVEVLIGQRLPGRIDGLDKRITELDKRLSGRIDGLDGKITELDRTLSGEIKNLTLEFAKQTRVTVLTIIGTGVALFGALAAAPRFF